MFDPRKMFTEAMVNRKGKTIEVRTRDGQLLESDSIEANLLFEILQQLKKR